MPHATDTAILGLPGEEVEQSSKWLANQAETDPEDTVADSLAQRIAHFFKGRGQDDQRQLENHAKKCNTFASQLWDINSEERSFIPMKLWVGIPTNISCKMAESANTIPLAASGLHPRPTKGE